jgi:hypothetical protein
MIMDVQMRQLPDDIMNTLGQRAGEVVAEVASQDPTISRALFTYCKI